MIAFIDDHRGAQSGQTQEEMVPELQGIPVKAGHLELLDCGIDMAHAGGFYTADRREYLRCEKLRQRGMLRFWKGRRSPFWSAQFFDITDKGRTARLEARR